MTDTTTRLDPIDLCGIPETMLWTLHSRAPEAMPADARLHDPAAVNI